MSKRLCDQVIEEAGRRIYESQQARISDQTSFAANRAWRSRDVPVWFWDSYCEDARAALSLNSIKIPTRRITRDANLECAQLRGLRSGRYDFPSFGPGADWAEDERRVDLMKATIMKKEGKARPPIQVTLSVPAELLKKIDDWASVNYPGIKVREKAMLCLFEMAMGDHDGMSVDLARG